MSTKKQGFASLSPEQRKAVSRKGGAVKVPTKGFGSATPEMRKSYAQKRKETLNGKDSIPNWDKSTVGNEQKP